MFLSVQEFVLIRVNELRSFRTKVDSLEGVRLDLVDSPDHIQYPVQYTCNRRCNKVNLLLRDVILVNFGVHMCAHYLSMLIPISQA